MKDRGEPADDERQFYRRAMRILQKHRLPFLVGGAYGQRPFTGLERHTKDLDLFVRPQHCKEALRLISRAGYRTEIRESHWLAKAFDQRFFIDFILGFSNGISQVDDLWFEHAVKGEVLGVSVDLVAPEEAIWMKCFVQERDRFDGADVYHLIRSCNTQLDWRRLLNHFGSNWRVLLSHLINFGFVYPGDRRLVPVWLMDELLRRLGKQLSRNGESGVCQGTLFSKTEYVTDIEKEGLRDARLLPSGA